jgi:hypothetical protein
MDKKRKDAQKRKDHLINIPESMIENMVTISYARGFIAGLKRGSQLRRGRKHE